MLEKERRDIKTGKTARNGTAKNDTAFKSVMKKLVSKEWQTNQKNRGAKNSIKPVQKQH